MLLRNLKLVDSEFTEVLDLSLVEKDSQGHYCSLCRVRIPFVTLEVRKGFYVYSVECTERGFGYVSKEVFHLKNFLELVDWRDKLDSYDDFVLGRL